MKRLAPLAFAVTAFALTSACSGGGTSSVVSPTAQPPGNTPADVVFLVTVPAPMSAARTRTISAPQGTQSVSVTLASVNGAAVTGAAPTVQNIASGATGCTAAGNQLVCQFAVAATVGNDVFTVHTYAQANASGSVTGAGDVSVNAVSAATTIAPTVLNGTVASIAITAPFMAEGAAGSAPLVVAAKDANGYTIIGQYTNAITLNVTDASAQTSISATNVPDSTTAAALTLSYKGGAMSNAAVISATAANVAGTAVTPGSFLPSGAYPTVNGSSVTYNVAGTGTTYGAGTPPPAPTALPTMTVTQSYATSASFNGLTNLIAITTAYSSVTPNNALPNPATPENGVDYYEWAQGANATTLQHVGYSHVLNVPGEPGSDNLMCQAPYPSSWVLPLASSWNAYNGTGACTETVSATGYSTLTENTMYNADGSYNTSATASFSSDTQTVTLVAKADGTATLTESNTAMQPSLIITIETPAPNSPTIPVTTEQFSGPIPTAPAVTPSPTATTIPNWYLAAGLPQGTVPSPLRSDVFTPKGTAALPATCQVGSGIVPAGSTYTEVDEAFSDFDPLSGYTSSTTNWFFVNGLGVVCAVTQSKAYAATSVETQNAIADSITTTNTTQSLTLATLLTAMNKTRSFAQAYPAAQAGIVATVQRGHGSRIAAALIRRLQTQH